MYCKFCYIYGLNSGRNGSETTWKAVEHFCVLLKGIVRSPFRKSGEFDVCFLKHKTNLVL